MNSVTGSSLFQTASIWQRIRVLWTQILDPSFSSKVLKYPTGYDFHTHEWIIWIQISKQIKHVIHLKEFGPKNTFCFLPNSSVSLPNLSRPTNLPSVPYFLHNFIFFLEFWGQNFHPFDLKIFLSSPIICSSHVLPLIKLAGRAL